MKLPFHTGLIWAQSLNGVIGRDNKIPSEFDNDLSYFREITINSTIVMGRKTWISLGCKPLPFRTNVIFSRNLESKVESNVTVISKLEDLNVDTESLYFIGGKEIYELGLPYANLIYATVNEINVLGDVSLPTALLKLEENKLFKCMNSDTYQSKKGHTVSRNIYIRN